MAGQNRRPHQVSLKVQRRRAESGSLDLATNACWAAGAQYPPEGLNSIGPVTRTYPEVS